MVDEFIAAGSSKKFGIVGICFGGGKVVDVPPEDHNDYFALGVLKDNEGNTVGGLRVVFFKGRGRGFVHRPASTEDDQDA
nr:carboxymethylenebutenolidase homolog [Tanacetum cinerariifolium]